MGMCMGEWVGEWVGSGKMTNLIKLELIMICGDTPTYGWIGGLMGRLMLNL